MRPPSRPAPALRRPALAAGASRAGPSLPCEPLEARRLFAVEVISAAAGAPLTTGDGVTRDLDLHGGSPTASTVSDDGRYVAFSSSSDNLVAGLTPDGLRNVFVRDRAAGTTTLVSAGALDAGNADGQSVLPSVSGDGRFVAFYSDRPFVAADANGHGDIYLRDLQAGTTTLVSRTPSGAGGNNVSGYASVSRNGRYVVFFTAATDILPGTGSEEGGIYRYDVQTGAVEEVATSRLNAIVDGPQMSDDGNLVAYYSSGPDEGDSTLFEARVKDMRTGVVTVASVAADGAPAPGRNEFSMELSGDGRKVAFSTLARATPNDTNDAPDVFLRDLAAGTTTLVSVGPGGTSVPGSGGPQGFGSALSLHGGRSLSTDGRFVLFESADQQTDVPDRDTEPRLDVYVRDLVTNTTTLLSVDWPGNDHEEGSMASLSADGRYAAFMSYLPTFGGGPTWLRVVETLTANEVAVANSMPDGSYYDLGEAAGYGAVLSRSGNLLVFGGESDADGLAPGLVDGNGDTDLFAVALAGGQPADAQPPTVTVLPLPPLNVAAPHYEFDVYWEDDVRMDPASVGDGDISVIFPAGGDRVVQATLVSATPSADGRFVTARYRVAGPDGVFDWRANGTYQLHVVPNAVSDAAGNLIGITPIPGTTFTVGVPVPDGPDLQAVSLDGALPPALVGGARQKVKPVLFKVTNTGNTPAIGAINVRLVASADFVPDAGDAVVAEVAGQRLRLAPGKFKVFRLKASEIPAALDGEYRLLAVADSGGALVEWSESNNVAHFDRPLRIAAPFADLAVERVSYTGLLPRRGRPTTALITLRNDGNSAAVGVKPVRVRVTADPENPAAPSHEVDVPMKLNLKPGASRQFRVRLNIPDDIPVGTYRVAVALLAGGPWTDPNPFNDFGASEGGFSL